MARVAGAGAAAGGSDFASMSENCNEYLSGLASATAVIQAGAKGTSTADAVRTSNAEALRLLRGVWRLESRESHPHTRHFAITSSCSAEHCAAVASRLLSHHLP